MSAWNGGQAAETGHWSWRQVDVGAFKDARLGRRFGDLLRRLSEVMGGSIPFACQDWSNTKAAYRFFSNPRVEESEILKGHFAATRGRYDESDGPILVLRRTRRGSERTSLSIAHGFDELGGSVVAKNACERGGETKCFELGD
jgi:hypothetical protein